MLVSKGRRKKALALLCLTLFLYMFIAGGNAITEKDPYYQYLPDCSSPFTKIQKQTKAKAILCPMIKDEQGFLSEWVAYYTMHGFDHIMIFDDGSTDAGREELKYWIDSGVVSVHTNWTTESLRVNPRFMRNDFKKAMTIKSLLETECKLQALRWGYDFTLSLDIDEYVIPKRSGVTIVDELLRYHNTTQRNIVCIGKDNFASTPHILEPVNLLTIEAYQTKMPVQSKMNYYMSVSPKCGYQLSSPSYSVNDSLFLAECCHFHGCQRHDFRMSDFCTLQHKQVLPRIGGRGKPWIDVFTINHYSRSLEKYDLKSKSWTTATGEAKAGQTAEQAAKSYDIPKFLSRNVGWQHDDVALRYSCQLREVLRNATQEEVYLRPGNYWYRNPEFGKPIEDPDKRGRYGRPNQPGYKAPFKNPYNYHGKALMSDENNTQGDSSVYKRLKRLVRSKFKGQ